MINFDQVFRAVKEAYSLAEKMHVELSAALLPNEEGAIVVCRDKILAQEVVNFKAMIEDNCAYIDKYGLQDNYVEELRLCVDTFCMWVKTNFKNHQVMSEWVLEILNSAFNEKGVI